MMSRDEIEQVFSVAFAAAKENIYAKRWQVEFPELWSDEQFARHVPLRVEFEHVLVFGTVAEAVSWAGGFGGDKGRGRNKRGWGRIVRIDPLAANARLIRDASPASTRNLRHSVGAWKRGGTLNA